MHRLVGERVRSRAVPFRAAGPWQRQRHCWSVFEVRQQPFVAGHAKQPHRFATTSTAWRCSSLLLHFPPTTTRNTTAPSLVVGLIRRPFSSSSSSPWPSVVPPPPGEAGATAGAASSSSSFNKNESFFTAEQKQVMDKCRELHASIMPLNERIRGPLAAESDRGTALPFVLMVGNHSSGKSSFINYVLGRNIQTAGVAPTDDSFTIIAPGPADRDQDGPALIGDPDLGFQQLRQFGPTLMHHTALKIRSNIDSNFIMVDSPGMIDSPGSTLGMLQHANDHQLDGEPHDRGYDFTGVIRWMAQRADVVCLFFDPDKPGTTGESLHILLHALSGMDHKLLIVLNKADQFLKIHDFARAYGSLCWNLSKVIPRKDLPRIYTMCLPNAMTTTTDRPENSSGAAASTTIDNEDTTPTTTTTTTIPSALQDLYTARDEVVEQVRKAPARRMDNVITHLYDAVRQLQMHCNILQDLQQRYNRLYWQGKWQQLGVAGTGGGLATIFSTYGHGVVPLPVTGGVLAATIVATGAMTWYHGRLLAEWEVQAYTVEELSAAFSRTHAREISDGDEYTAALWQRVRDPLRMALQQETVGQFPTVSAAELAELQSIVEHDIPALRRLVSPTHYGKDDENDDNDSGSSGAATMQPQQQQQ